MKGRKQLRQEDGSALVMVLFVVLIFTILGMGILSATLGGAQRTATRESDVQSLHLAEKSLDEAVAYITSQLEGRQNIEPEELTAVIQEVRSRLDQADKLPVSTDLTSRNASGGVVDIQYETASADRQKTSYKMTLTSSADVNGVKRNLQQVITIDAYPDFLNYALGSENDLTLNGAPEVTGNMYAGGDMKVSNIAHYIYKGAAPVKETDFPFLNGDAYVQSLSRLFLPAWVDPSSGSSGEITLAQSSHPSGAAGKIFHIPENAQNHIKIKSRKKFVQINVEESVLDKLTEAVGGREADREFMKSSGNLAGLLTSGHFGTLQQLRMPEEPGNPPAKPAEDTDEAWKAYYAELDLYEQKVQEYRNKMIQLQNTLENLASSSVFDGTLTIDGATFASLKFTGAAKNEHKWLIVTGDLNINNLSQQELETFGNIIVLGNVNIHGRASFNGTIYVLGQTRIVDASVSGLGTGQLVLISKGDVLITRVDAFVNSEPMALKGFFYTDGEAELYGVGSIFSLQGGFFAKGNLTVNAALGQAAAGDQVIQFEPAEQRIGDQLLKRFNVTYDGTVFEEQQTGLPRVKQVSIHPGPKRLLNSP
ncbi:hypothetical protein Q5741_09170 [Paenibacillus sp. JX-17]|uniref:Type 4 fimbrial biogenesis protein PilX N-terminal domain-containing protein n=1 Tax=Paenibacillus lacisoli TaxID=3064525 RepID=A0ABT9CBF0_9BACL|nr:hypothetical protein [Paenibacillus sp. JX-17]MDO7906590.1 hypothetical protein [Paenibacillus sp. JX-17]